MIGLETGDMYVYKLNIEKEWVRLYEFSEYFSHCSTVRRIKFNKSLSKPEKDEYVVATCGND